MLAAMLLVFGLSAATADDSGSARIMGLTRCLECIYYGCDSKGFPSAYSSHSTISLGTNREGAMRNTDTGQRIQTFVIERDVVLVTASPPPRRPIAGRGRVPGFFIYSHGTPFFCPSAQVRSIYDAAMDASQFKVQLAGMEQPKGLYLERYAPDGSLGQIFGMEDKDLKPKTRLLECHDDLDLGEKSVRDNPAMALADAARFGMIEMARLVCGRAVPYEHTRLASSLRGGCLKPDIAFPAVMHREANRAIDIVSGSDCKRSGIEGFFDGLRPKPADAPGGTSTSD